MTVWRRERAAVTGLVEQVLRTNKTPMQPVEIGDQLSLSSVRLAQNALQFLLNNGCGSSCCFRVLVIAISHCGFPFLH